MWYFTLHDRISRSVHSFFNLFVNLFQDFFKFLITVYNIFTTKNLVRPQTYSISQTIFTIKYFVVWTIPLRFQSCPMFLTEKKYLNSCHRMLNLLNENLNVILHVGLVEIILLKWFFGSIYPSLYVDFGMILNLFFSFLSTVNHWGKQILKISWRIWKFLVAQGILELW